MCYNGATGVIMQFPEWLYTIDILFGAVVIVFVLRGLRNRLSGELARLFTLIVLLAAVRVMFAPLLARALEAWTVMPPAVVKTVVPTLFLLAGLFLFLLLRSVFQGLFKDKLGELVDKITGALVGAVRGALIGIVIVGGLLTLPDDALYNALTGKSKIGAWVCDTVLPWFESDESPEFVPPDNGEEFLTE
jgi:uncharacterized membrane protein required for colicin V production